MKKFSTTSIILGSILILFQILSFIGNKNAGITINLNFNNVNIFFFDLMNLLGYLIIGIVGILLVVIGIVVANIKFKTKLKPTMTKKSNLKGSLILCTAALLWGLAFVVQNRAADKVPPFAFNCLRSFIGAVFLFGFLTIMSIKNKDFVPVPKTINKKTLFIGSAVCGTVLAVATNFQQFGIAAYPDTAPVEARSGFITALYVIVVPLLSIFVKKRVPLIVWIASLVAIVGFYMLCLFEGAGGFYLADILVLFCTFAFSMHIIVVDKYCGEIGGIRLSAFQFVFCGIVSGVMSLIFELDIISLSDIKSVIPEILYMGIVSSGIAYTLQIVGQKYAEPAIASLSMSLESVFAALGGWVITGNALKNNEILGCLLVFAAIVLAQIPEFFKSKNT